MKKAFISLFLISSIIMPATVSLAQVNDTGKVNDNGKVNDSSSDGCPAGQTCLTNPLTANTPQELIKNVLTGILGIVGSLALLMFVYGGFTWMMAAGNAENVKRGRDILVWATIGLVVIFSSYALIGFIMKSLGVK